MVKVRIPIMLFIIFITFLLLLSSKTALADTNTDTYRIDSWQAAVETPAAEWSIDDVIVNAMWSDSTASIRSDVQTTWIRAKLPEFNWTSPGVLIPSLYGHSIDVYIDQRPIFTYDRNYMYDVHKLIFPIEYTDRGKWMYIRIESLSERIGIDQAIKVDDFQRLLSGLIRGHVTDVAIGGALLFLSFIMVICSFFLKREQNVRWLSLALLIFSTGVLVSSYSMQNYSFYGKLGLMLQVGFDLSLFIFLTALTYYFEHTIIGRFTPIIRGFRKFQMGYALFCTVALILNIGTRYEYYDIYFFLSVTMLGFIIIAQLILLVGISIHSAFRGHTDAMIFSGGFVCFAAAGVTDLVLFYARNAQYELVLWEWGILGFVLSLIILLNRRFARDHVKLINYSKELEMFNHQQQRSEKMQMISELAASVAHEVRNPLQVTRGFLQLMGEKAENKQRMYLDLAVEELDRASDIITDFLTFAKPQWDQETLLNLKSEFTHIFGVIAPLTKLRGGEIIDDIPANLYVRGNSAKFKQAMINMIKNSVEAFKGKGQVSVQAYEEKKQVVIRIQDNGEGMDQETLKNLGQPYFSTKTQGTGLGLMVTFRIIEVMQGTIRFKSEIGVGTESEIRFPLVDGPSG